MDELIKAALEAPVANLLIVAGLVFLGIAVVGRVGDKIEPDKTGRIASGGLGVLFLVVGLAMHLLTEPSSTSPTRTATPAPTSCSVSPIERFRDVYDREQLGCSERTLLDQQMARQDFEKGLMLWRADSEQIYVVYDDGQWQTFDDSWDEGQSAISCSEAETHDTSVARGFGQIWCDQIDVRNRLGKPKTLEFATSGDIQHFEKGVIVFDATTGEMFVLDAAMEQ